MKSDIVMPQLKWLLSKRLKITETSSAYLDTDNYSANEEQTMIVEKNLFAR